MVVVVAAAVVSVLAWLLPIGRLAIPSKCSWSSSLSTSPEAAATVVNVFNAVIIVVVIHIHHHCCKGKGEEPAAGWGGVQQVLHCHRPHHSVIIRAVHGHCAVKGGVPQIGVMLTIAGWQVTSKRAADDANNSQPLHVEGGQAAACKKSNG